MAGGCAHQNFGVYAGLTDAFDLLAGRVRTGSLSLVIVVAGIHARKIGRTSVTWNTLTTGT